MNVTKVFNSILIPVRNNLKFSVSNKKCSLPSVIEHSAKENKSPLEKATEDLSSFTPYFPATYNLAAYVNKSEVLQSLLHLNVNLHKIEKRPYITEKILKLDVNKDLNKHLIFLKDYVSAESIGKFLTKNPLILCEPLEDLQVRINYLQSKYFTKQQIQTILTKNPFWLMFSTIRIDQRLGHFQANFDLSGVEVRTLCVHHPKIITYNLYHVKINTFVIKEELGFDNKEVKQLILTRPHLFTISQKSLRERFNFIHNVMKISHETLLFTSSILLARNHIVKKRHFFLKSMGRAQYDPKKENYVPLMALAAGTDIDFCKEYAKCNIDDFNTFLKTL